MLGDFVWAIHTLSHLPMSTQTHPIFHRILSKWPFFWYPSNLLYERDILYYYGSWLICCLLSCVCVCPSQYLKMRLKYYKEIVSYLSKRAQIGKISLLNCRGFSCHLSLSLSLSLHLSLSVICTEVCTLCTLSLTPYSALCWKVLACWNL